MSKNCKHEWLPLGNDRWSCKHCAMVKVGYVAELKQQLAEKDKEIERIKNLILHLTDGKGAILITRDYLEGKEKIFKVENLRHQTCEKIRDELGEELRKQFGKYKNHLFYRENEAYNLAIANAQSVVEKVLDQIEKGE